MADTPQNWEHNSGYRLNADGKSIEYIHTDQDLRAIVEAMVNEEESRMEYYTVIFEGAAGQESTIEPHEIHQSKEAAQEHIKALMEKHS
jgi:hypothetical protein